jgi:hypothetical protein
MIRFGFDQGDAMRSFSLVIMSLCVALAACGRDKANNSDAGGDAGNAVKIQDVQSDAMPPGTPVTLIGKVVTAVDGYGARTGDLWVEEPEGGPMSGVHVYKADPTVVSTLKPGDIVNVTNCVKANFALMTDTSGRTEVELEPPMSGAMVTVTKTGTGTVPAPATVDALAIGKMPDPDRSNQWKMWDGVLVTVNNVSQVSSVAQVGGKTPDPTLQKFNITGVALVESDLAAFPTTGLGFNSCLASVTGVVSYFFDYQILNRSTAEIVTGGSNCPPPENSVALCSDSIDNDGNGYTDCMDNNCIILTGSAMCRATTTISAVDSAADANPMAPTLPAGMPVGVELGNGGNADVYITAISTSMKDVWVATNKQAGADGGMDIYMGGLALPNGAVVGARVDVIGSLKAYNNDTQGETLPELQGLQMTVSAAPNGPGITAVTTQSAATLTVAATGRPYVGSMVTLPNVKIVSAPDPANHNNAMLSSTPNGGTTATMFEAAADAHVLTGAAGTCYLTMTGIWTYDVYNNTYALEPTGEGTGTSTMCK